MYDLVSIYVMHCHFSSTATDDLEQLMLPSRRLTVGTRYRRKAYVISTVFAYRAEASPRLLSAHPQEIKLEDCLFLYEE